MHGEYCAFVNQCLSHWDRSSPLAGETLLQPHFSPLQNLDMIFISFPSGSFANKTIATPRQPVRISAAEHPAGSRSNCSNGSQMNCDGQSFEPSAYSTATLINRIFCHLFSGFARSFVHFVVFEDSKSMRKNRRGSEKDSKMPFSQDTPKIFLIRN